MSKFSFTQAGWEAYQTAIEVLSATAGASFQVDANKHWLPISSGVQNIGSATVRFGVGYFSQLDMSGATAGSAIVGITNTDTGTTSDGRVYASNGTNKIGMIARSAPNTANQVAGVADMLYYTDATAMSWFWGSNIRMRGNSNMLSMGTIDGVTGTTGSSILSGAWAPTTDTSGAALNDKVGGALVLTGGAGTGAGAGGNLYFSYFPAGTTGNVQGSRVNIFHMDGTGLMPELNSTYDLGSTSFRMANVYSFNADIGNNLTIGSTGVVNMHGGSFYKSSAGRMGFFTTSPVVDFQIGGGPTYREVRMLRNADGVTGQALIMYKSRGTESTPTAVLSGDTFGNIMAGGYDSTGTPGYRSSVSIGFVADAAATSGILPGRIYFGVQPPSPAAAGIVNYMTIGPSEVRPVLNNVTTLGTSAVRWSAAYAVNVDFTGTLTAGTGTWAVGTTQITKDASGNVGLGIAAAGSMLHMYKSAASTQYILTLENDYSGAGTTTDVGLVMKTHNGTASVAQGYLYTTNSLWSGNAAGANAIALDGVGTGGVAVMAENAAGTVRTYAGGSNAAALISTASSSGLAINNTQNFSAANVNVFQKAYSVAPATNVPVELTKGVTTLTTGYTYRVRSVVQGTSSITGSVYLVSYNGTSWVATAVSTNGQAAMNCPQVAVSGTTLNLFHNHASGTYTIFVVVEAAQHGNTTTNHNAYWGVDGLFTHDQQTNTLTTLSTIFKADTPGIAGVATSMYISAAGNGGAGRGVGMLFAPPGSAGYTNAARIDAYQEAASATATAAALAISVADSAAGVMTERLRWNKLGETIFGNGEAVAAPNAAVLRGTDASGTDIAGASITIRPGRGTGTGGSGSITIQTAAPGTTSATLNTLATAAVWNAYGQLGIGLTPHTGWFKVANMIDFRGGRGAVGIATGGSVDATFLSANAVAASNDLGVTTWTYVNTGSAAEMELRGGFRFNYAASGTGGAALTWTSLGTWDSSNLTSNTHVRPGTTATYDLGTTALRWNNAYLTNVDFTGTLTASTGNWTVGTTQLVKSGANFGFGKASPINAIDVKTIYTGSLQNNGAIRIENYNSTLAGYIDNIGGLSVFDSSKYSISGDRNPDTTASSGMVMVAGSINFYANTGLTAGTAYTPTSRWQVAPTANTSSVDMVVSSTTAATSTSTGAVRIAGGASVAGNVYIGGNVVPASVTVDSAGAGLYTTATSGRLIMSGGTTTTDGACIVLRGSTYATAPGQLELWSWGTSGANRWTIGGSTDTGHLYPATHNVSDIGKSTFKVRAGYFTTMYADVYPDNPSKNYVKWATTADIAPSTYSAGVLTGYGNAPTVALTTTLGNLLVTTTSTAGVKAGAIVSAATASVPANSVVYAIGAATTMTLQKVPGFTLTTTAITGTGTAATATYAAQSAPPWVVGDTIYVSGATPSTYNGTFTVTACTSTSVTWASAETAAATVQGSITNFITTAITGTGTTATATFAARTYAPFAVGGSITITGATPATYNGTFTVTACTTTTVSWASTETVTATVQGYVAAGIAAGTSVNTTFAQTIAAFTPDGTAATVGDRVLVKDVSTLGGLNSNGQYTGAYTVTTVGSTTVPWVLTRAIDSDTMAELAGATYVVLAGTQNGGKSFRSYAKSTDTLDTTQILWNKLIDQLASSRGPTPTTTVGVDIATDTKTVMFTGGNIATFAANSLARLTAATTSASTYTVAATLYIGGTPIAAGNTTITNPYSIYVNQGQSYFNSASAGGAIQAVGYSNAWGTTGGTSTGGVNIVMGTSASATWLISGTSSATFRGGIQLLDAGGVMRVYTNTSTGFEITGNNINGFSGAAAGIGNALSISGGAGQAGVSGATAGYAGGAANLIGGTGGAGFSGGTGGAGGAASVSGGAGAATNGAGGSANITGGAGSGTGNGGNVVLTGGAGGASGVRGNVVTNGTNVALATTATSGFLTIPSVAGVPTGVPVNVPAGNVAIAYDATNNKIMVYNGAWKAVTLA